MASHSQDSRGSLSNAEGRQQVYGNQSQAEAKGAIQAHGPPALPTKGGRWPREAHGRPSGRSIWKTGSGQPPAEPGTAHARLRQFKGRLRREGGALRAPRLLPRWGLTQDSTSASSSSSQGTAPHLGPPWLFPSKAPRSLGVSRSPGSLPRSGSISASGCIGGFVYSAVGTRGCSVDKEKWAEGL